jgi:sec-independent protein translocase protein TatA
MNTILLFGMPGGTELIFIILIVVMLFGSKKIPELARGLGKGISEIKNATGEIQREITEGTRDLNSLKDKVNVEKQVKDLFKGDQQKKESSVDSPQPSVDSQETTSQEQEPSKEQPNSQTVKRRSPYAAEESKSNSVEE